MRLANLRPALAPVVPRVARAYGLPRTCAGGGVAITFDDGPHPEGTPAILSILADAGVQATFFLVGEQVRARPALAAEIVSAGHAVALHADRHRLELRCSARALAEDLARGRCAIAEATGVEVSVHRPPYGIYSASGLRLVREAGLSPLLWSRWGKDWRKFTTPARIAARASADLGPGDVILLHDADFYSARDSHRRTARALPAIISTVRQRELTTILAV